MQKSQSKVEPLILIYFIPHVKISDAVKNLKNNAIKNKHKDRSREPKLDPESGNCNKLKKGIAITIHAI